MEQQNLFEEPAAKKVEEQQEKDKKSQVPDHQETDQKNFKGFVEGVEKSGALEDIRHLLLIENRESTNIEQASFLREATASQLVEWIMEDFLPRNAVVSQGFAQREVTRTQLAGRSLAALINRFTIDPTNLMVGSRPRALAVQKTLWADTSLRGVMWPGR